MEVVAVSIADRNPYDDDGDAFARELDGSCICASALADSFLDRDPKLISEI